jgi:hypothetical protein
VPEDRGGAEEEQGGRLVFEKFSPSHRKEYIEDHGGRGDRRTPGHDTRMARRRKVPELEIRELLMKTQDL